MNQRRPLTSADPPPAPTGTSGADGPPPTSGPQPWTPGERPRHAHHRRVRRRRTRRRVVTVVLAAVAALAVAVAGFAVWAEHQISPGGKPGRLVTVVIPKGASTEAIGKILASDGVVHEGTLFAYYVRLKGSGPLLAGTYRLHENSGYTPVIAALAAGPPIVTEKLVIPEGFTMAEIAKRVAALPGFGLSAQKFLAAASSGDVRSPYEPAGVDNLEGLVFPATYDIRKGESEVDILQTMVGAFDAKAQALGLSKAASSLGFTPYQVVTVASIVEGEAKLDAQRGDVASVLYNRLHRGIPLGADSTLMYALRQANPNVNPATVNYNQPNPYNTRVNKGLPPTPINNPGLPSLEAAAAPPTTSYLYFVEVRPDGTLGFASTTTGFDHLVAQCRAAKLC